MVGLEFDPKDAVFVRIDRRRKLPASIILRALEYSSEEILETFFENNTVTIKGEDVSINLIAERLRGEVATFDIAGPNGKTIVEMGRRITARHVRLIEDSGMKKLGVPREYLLEQITAKDIVDESTGEVAIPCNSIITEEVLEQLFELKVSSFETIYTNDLDCGPFISDTMRVDPSSNRLEALVEIIA